MTLTEALSDCFPHAIGGNVNELALFAGAGGGILGGHLLGWQTVCAVEFDAYAASVLVARQNDGCLEAFPVWDDVRTFDGNPWRGIVDVVSGGFPCQDISAAGKGAGIDGERSGLWSEMARIIGEVRPRFAFVENSRMLTSRGLGRVLGDLAEMGYDARWGCVSAADAIFAAGDPAAYHGRERIWIAAADADVSRLEGSTGQRMRGTRRASVELAECGVETSNAAGSRLEKRQRQSENDEQKQPAAERANWWQAEPAVGRVVDGMANRVDRLKCIGNGQVPAVAAIAWRLLACGE